MKSTIPTPADRVHGVLPDVRPVMAKASVRIPDVVDWMRAIGAAIQRAVKAAGLSNKEAAAACGVDDAEFGKWISGSGAEKRRPQFDRLFAVAVLRRPLVIAFAELAGEGVEIVTEIRVTRKVA